jgi:hypothetical protein
MEPTLEEKKIIELTEIIAIKDDIAKTDESIIQSLKEQIRILKDIRECDAKMDLYNKSIIASLKSQINLFESNANRFSKGVIAGAIITSIIYFIINLIFHI